MVDPGADRDAAAIRYCRSVGRWDMDGDSVFWNGMPCERSVKSSLPTVSFGCALELGVTVAHDTFLHSSLSLSRTGHPQRSGGNAASLFLRLFSGFLWLPHAQMRPSPTHEPAMLSGQKRLASIARKRFGGQGQPIRKCRSRGRGLTMVTMATSWSQTLCKLLDNRDA